MKHMFSAIAILALAACQTEEGEVIAQGTESLPVDQAGPGVGALDLEIDGAVEVGAVVRFYVSGARPGEKVFVLVDNEVTPGSYCPPFLGGLCADLPNPTPIKSTKANDDGVAAFQITIPAIPAGQWYFQATTLNATAATSDIVGRFTRAASGVFTPFVFHDWILDSSNNYLAGAMIVGAFGDDTANPDALACFASSNLDALARPVCPGCEFAFAVNPSGGFVEEEVDAECASYVGITPTYMDWFFAASAGGNGGWAGIAGGTTWGIDTDYDIGGGATAPYALFNDPTYGWYPLGQADVAPYATAYTEVFFGIAYTGPFYY